MIRQSECQNSIIKDRQYQQEDQQQGQLREPSIASTGDTGGNQTQGGVHGSKSSGKEQANCHGANQVPHLFLYT